jgi:hypothetical protein
MPAQQLKGEGADRDGHEKAEDAESGVDGLFHGLAISMSLI